MFRKVVETFEKASVKAALREGKLVCPDCGKKAGNFPPKWDEVMECHACGTKTSLSEWVTQDGVVPGRADLPPQATKIRRESDGHGGITWHIAAQGKFGFFLFFAAFWLGITVLVSGGFLITIINGGKIEGNMPEWVLIPFFGIFYAIGFGVLYVGLRQKFMCHRLIVSGGGVTLRSDMFGRKKEKSLQPGTLKSVAQKEFYQQNYKPVFGIEIKGSGGKLRFGSALTMEDKAWLTADIKEALFGREVVEPKMSVAGHSPGTRKQVFSVKMPGPQKFDWVGGLFFTLMAVGFIFVGIFLIEGEPLPKNRENSGDFFQLFISLFSNGFRGIWLLMSTAFAGIGIAVLVASLRCIGQERRIEGNSTEVSIRTYKRGLIVKDKSYPRSAITDIRSSKTGYSNGSTMKRIELIVGNKVERIASWAEGDEADEMVAEVR